MFYFGLVKLGVDESGNPENAPKVARTRILESSYGGGSIGLQAWLAICITR